MSDHKSKARLPIEASEISVRQPAELLNWLPVDAMLVGERPCIKWIEWPARPFAEPFFSQTVERAQKAGARQLVTSLDVLLQLEKLCDSVRPAGFIFHGSRCGSTLLANVSRVLDGAVVISEAAIIEKILGRFFLYADDSSARSVFNATLLRAAVTVLGQRRVGTEQKLIIKFSALSTLQFRWVRRIWSDVPCVFMFRNPVEVIASNIRNVPEWMQFDSIPEQAAAVTGLNPETALKLDSEERCARALSRFYGAGRELAGEGAWLIDHNQLSIKKLTRAIEFFGFTPNNDERDRISAVARLYSKDSTPGREFAADSSDKQATASRRVREVAERWAMDSYQRLRGTMSAGNLA